MQDLVAHRAREVHALSEPEPARLRTQRAVHGAVADDHQWRLDPRHGVEQHVQTFVMPQSSHEQQIRIAEALAQRTCGRTRAIEFEQRPGVNSQRDHSEALAEGRHQRVQTLERLGRDGVQRIRAPEQRVHERPVDR